MGATAQILMGRNLEMKNEKSLSAKEKYLGTGKAEDDCIFKKKDVKSAVRRLKKRADMVGWIHINEVNEIFGKELT